MAAPLATCWQRFRWDWLRNMWDRRKRMIWGGDAVDGARNICFHGVWEVVGSQPMISECMAKWCAGNSWRTTLLNVGECSGDSTKMCCAHWRVFCYPVSEKCAKKLRLVNNTPRDGAKRQQPECNDIARCIGGLVRSNLKCAWVMVLGCAGLCLLLGSTIATRLGRGACEMVGKRQRNLGREKRFCVTSKLGAPGGVVGRDCKTVASAH